MATTVIHIKEAPAGWRTNPDYVYIGRGSKWGNPYKIGAWHPTEAGVILDRDAVCDLFEKEKLPRLEAWGELRYLKDKILVCFCHPQRCHGHSLAAAVNKH